MLVTQRDLRVIRALNSSNAYYLNYSCKSVDVAEAENYL